MGEMVSANWILLVGALVLGILVAWWVFTGSRRTQVTREEDKPEDSVARRNQALIDAPPAASPPPAAPQPAPPAPGEIPVVGEAVAPAPPVDQSIAVAPAPTPTPPASTADDLTRIKGVGPKLAQQLRDLNVTAFAQIAAWTDADIDRIDAQLGRFQGRIRRDDWVEQARLLASGDTGSYEARFGKL